MNQFKTFLHTISSPKIIDEAGNDFIKIYESPEIKALSALYKNKRLKSIEEYNTLWKIFLKDSSNSGFKSKYFALLPMFFENKFSNASELRYIVSMGLNTKHKKLIFKSVEASGVVDFQEDLNDIVPIPIEDYLAKKKILRSMLPEFVDGDMIYINRKTLTQICFDKFGTWYKSGVEHELLNLEKLFNEKNWLDHLYWDKEWY